MDLGSGLVSYNGWTNNLTRIAGGAPANGWEIIRADVSPIGVTQYLDKRALQDGMDAIDVFKNQRTIQMIVGVYGSTKGAFYDNLQSLLTAFDPVLAYNADSANSGFLALKFYQPTVDTATWTDPHGIPMQFFGRPAAPPTYSFERSATSGQSGKGLSANAAITLVCRDPRKYLQTTVSQNVTTASATVTNRGKYPSWPQFQWTIDPSIITSGSNSATIVLDSHTAIINLSGLTASADLVFDYETHIFTVGGTQRPDLVTTVPDFTQVKPNSGSTVKYSGNFLLKVFPPGNLKIVFREAWP